MYANNQYIFVKIIDENNNKKQSLFSFLNLHCYNWPGPRTASASLGGPVYLNLIINVLIYKYIAMWVPYRPFCG